MLIEFTRMHRQWMPGQVADLGSGIADAIVKSRRAVYATRRDASVATGPARASETKRRRKKIDS